jgi:hypothetical protein
MKNTRKLIPALAMLLVSAVMMSTASFAWFSMNTQVTASGMQVKAQATGGLAIAPWALEATEPAAAAFTKDATMGWSNKNTNSTLFPTSFDGTNWIKGEAANPNSHVGSSGKYGLVPAGGTGYYIASKWSLKSLAEEGSINVNLTGIEVTITGENTTTAQLKHALRVALKVGSTYYYFAPCYDSIPTGGLKYTTYENAGTPAYNVATYTAGAVTPGATFEKQIATGVTQTPTVVEVYIYFEGEDEYCTSAYAVNAQNINVKLTFTTAA